MCQLVRLDRIKQSTIAVPAPNDRRVIGARPFVVLRAPPPPWPSNIIGPPRHGDRRTPLERWQDFHFAWEQHFYG
jgi:hypothetical protein